MLSQISGTELIRLQCYEGLNAEQALYESEKRFRTIFETAVMGIVITSGRNSKIVECNPAFQTMLGYSEHELRRMTILDLTAQDDHEKSYAAFEELQSGNGIASK